MTAAVSDVERPPFRWSAAAATALALHAAAFAPMLPAPSRDLDASYEDLGTPMVVDFAAVPTAPDEGDSVAADAAEAIPTAPTREIEEMLSQKTEAELPKAETSPYEAPPDLRVAQQDTLKKQDAEQKEQTTEAQEARPEPAPAAAAAPSLAGAPSAADTGDILAAEAEGSSDKAARAVENWQRSVLAHLGRHKRYPEEARARHAEGEAVIAFRVDRSGRVLDARLERSSGVPALDREALQMLERARPLPAVPSVADSSKARLVVPVRYKLK